MANRIRMFEAHNIEGDRVEEVLVLVDGGEQEIRAFEALAKTKRPEHAEISRVVIEGYEGEVMKIGEYAQFCTTVQMNKAIPLLLSMNGNLLSMNGKMDTLVANQEETTAEIRGLRDDLAIRNNIEWQTRVEKDIRIIKSKLGIR